MLAWGVSSCIAGMVTTEPTKASCPGWDGERP
jgi:hypothetical protein